MIDELARHFRNQARFADGYSPLYADLFDIVAGWLTADPTDPVVMWLLAAAAGRPPFDVTLLLMAALHRDVLAGEPAAAALGRYYATAGQLASDQRQVTRVESLATGRSSRAGRRAGRRSSLAAALRRAILGRGDALAAFIRRANVQTNETGRGLVWLLPAVCAGWPAVHLIELGAGAGLNLVAERRGYRLADAADPTRVLLTLGDGPPQFTTTTRGAADLSLSPRSPAVLSRLGGDVAPFHLRTADDELTLAAFIWGDQPGRLARLREGIAALRAVEGSAAPVWLRPLRLPDELPGFLAAALPRPPGAPVVVYNTTVTMYLPDEGASLRGLIDNWAAGLGAPVVWAQWEPPRDGVQPPERDWAAWTVEYWPGDGGAARRRQLAWVHPHGVALQWEPGLGAFQAEFCAR